MNFQKMNEYFDVKTGETMGLLKETREEMGIEESAYVGQFGIKTKFFDLFS